MHWVEENKENIVEEKELTSGREGGAEGQGVYDLWENTFEELDAVVGVFTRFLELRTKSQYAHEMVPFAGAHNRSLIDQRQPGCLVPFERAGQRFCTPPHPPQS